MGKVKNNVPLVNNSQIINNRLGSMFEMNNILNNSPYTEPYRAGSSNPLRNSYAIPYNNPNQFNKSPVQTVFSNIISSKSKQMPNYNYNSGSAPNGHHFGLNSSHVNTNNMAGSVVPNGLTVVNRHNPINNNSNFHNSRPHYQVSPSKATRFQVNQHQLSWIQKRKVRREWLDNFMEYNKSNYVHESRHKHAMKRLRAPSGRFLTKEETEALHKNIPAAQNCPPVASYSLWLFCRRV